MNVRGIVLLALTLLLLVGPTSAPAAEAARPNRAAQAARAEDAGAAAVATAEGAPAAIDPRLAGHPEVVIRLSEERIEAPAQVAAGRTLLIEENLDEAPGHAFVLRVPDDVAEADVAAALGPEAPAMVVSTPEWFWRATFVGNADRAAAGGRAVGLVDLEPGRYVAGDPYRAPSEFARFEVAAGTAPASGVAAEGPAADVSAKLVEMTIAVPATVPAGPRLWRVENTGAMLHELAIIPVPAGATVEQVREALTAALAAEMAGGVFEEQGVPAGFGAGWAEWRAAPVAGVGVLSNGRPVVAQVDLAPGAYAAVCFIPLPQTGERHFEMGMTTVFTVS
jgi:hypothetical protein